MTETTVTQPIGFRATAAELRRLADALDSLGETPEGEREEGIYLSFGFLLETVAGVDQVTRALLGKEAATEKRGDSWYHIAQGGPPRGRGFYHVQTSVPAPPDERDAELAALRAEVSKLRAAAALTPDDVPHYGEVTDVALAINPAPVEHGEKRAWNEPGCGVECLCGTFFDGFETLAEAVALLDDHIVRALTEAGLVTEYFTLGDPVDGRDYYVEVSAPTAGRCRSLMVETYGSDWCDEYSDLPGEYEWVRSNRLVEWER